MFNTPAGQKFDEFRNKMLLDEVPKENLLDECGHKKIRIGHALHIDQCTEKQKNILKILSNFKVPSHNEYLIFSPPSNCEDLNKFLFGSIPSSQKSLCFNTYFNLTIDCKNYFISLKEAVSKFTEKIELNNLNLTISEFCCLAYCARKVKTLQLSYCIFTSETECNFGEMKGCKMEKLSLFACKENEDNSIKSQKELKFEVLRAIEKCENFHKSLKIINFSDGVGKEQHEIKTEIRRRFTKLSHIDIFL